LKKVKMTQGFSRRKKAPGVGVSARGNVSPVVGSCGVRL
jgi:hypothetical protein